MRKRPELTYTASVTTAATMTFQRNLPSLLKKTCSNELLESGCENCVGARYLEQYYVEVFLIITGLDTKTDGFTQHLLQIRDDG